MKTVVLQVEGKEIDLGAVEVEICSSSHCKEGYIKPDRWMDIQEAVRNEGIVISQVALSRLLFENFR